jgi:hypothetical protein
VHQTGKSSLVDYLCFSTEEKKKKEEDESLAGKNLVDDDIRYLFERISKVILSILFLDVAPSFLPFDSRKAVASSLHHVATHLLQRPFHFFLSTEKGEKKNEGEKKGGKIPRVELEEKEHFV